ncbi:MAG: DUF2378 family protein [Polyangiales bacterium]
MKRERVETSASKTLDGEVDLDAVLANVGDDYKRKGLLFLNQVRAIGEEFALVKPTLEEPPARFYIPFHDYPTRDYFRIFARAARKKFPNLPSAEAWRRQGRAEIATFVEVPIGRVTWALFDGPAQVFERYMQLSKMIVTKPIGIPERLGDNRVRITYPDPIGSWQYALGLIEAIVQGFRLHPRVVVEMEGKQTVFDIRWGV